MRVEKTVFISYRRTNAAWALAVYQYLNKNGYDVFFDFTSINNGDFEQIIIGNIKSRAHFLVILTPSALERCAEPNDWLRREIETALDEKRNIVPLMLEGFDYGSPSIAKYLTGKLALLSKYNAVRVPIDYFEEAMARICNNYFNTPLELVIHPASPQSQAAAVEEKKAANKEVMVTEKSLTAVEYCEQATPLWSKKAYSEIIALYDKAIGLKPNYAEAFYYRGMARYAKRDTAGAIKDLNEAIRLKPDFTDAYNHRGWINYTIGKVPETMHDYDKAIELKPDFADAYHNRGNTHQAKGENDRAIKDYNEAIRLKPDFAEAYNNRGYAYYNKGNYRAAKADWEKVLQLNSKHAGAQKNMELLKGKI